MDKIDIDDPEYNKQYHIWRNGIYLGIATFTQNDEVGDNFMMMSVNGNGDLQSTVYFADSWVLVKEDKTQL